MTEKIEHEVLRKIECNEKYSCPARIKIPGVAGSFVVTRNISPEHAAALAEHVGPGERLGWVPDELFDPYEGG